MTAEGPSRFRRLDAVPADLAAIVAVTTLVNITVFVPVVRATPLRVPLGVLFACFVPGYVLVATLFPETGRAVTGAESSPTTSGTRAASSPFRRTTIDGLERAVLSFGLSVAIVPGSALLLNYTQWGIRPASIVAVTTVVTLFLTIAAGVRRMRLSEAERFRVPVRGWVTTLRDEWAESTDRAETVLSLLLIVSVLFTAGSVGYAATTPGDGERFSEVYLLSENDGELIADEYPTEFERGESRELVVGIENNEHETTDYTIVAVEQTVEPNDGEAAVTEQREIVRFEIQLDHGETWQREHDVEPTIAGENVRLVWLVYPDGTVPDSPSTENAAYHVHLWADVTESNESS